MRELFLRCSMFSPAQRPRSTSPADEPPRAQSAHTTSLPKSYFLLPKYADAPVSQLSTCFNRPIDSHLPPLPSIRPKRLFDRSEVTLRPSEAGHRPKRSLPRPFPPYPRPFRSHLASPPKPLVTLPKSPATRPKSLLMPAKPLDVLSEATLHPCEVTRARPEATLRLSRSHPQPLRSHPR